jgi:hypothetical protein
LKVRVPISARSNGFQGMLTRAGHEMEYSKGSLMSGQPN